MAATSTILSNPKVLVGAVNLTGWCTSATVTRTVTALNDTVFGNTANTFTAGLEDNELTVTLFFHTPPVPPMQHSHRLSEQNSMSP